MPHTVSHPCGVFGFRAATTGMFDVRAGRIAMRGSLKWGGQWGLVNDARRKRRLVDCVPPSTLLALVERENRSA